MNGRLLSGLSSLIPLTILIGSAAIAQTAHFPEEGQWRGEFTVNGDKVPFNFELQGKNAAGAVLTLVNGSRRDAFQVTQPTPDSIFVRMNTYDAALEAKIQPDGRLVGVYKSLVPTQRGSELPFVAEHGKTYRFVDVADSQERASKNDLSGKWAIEIASKDAGGNQVALLRQNGNHLDGVFMTVVGDTRELAGDVQGDTFALSGFSGPSPVLVKGKLDEDGNLNGYIAFGIYKTIKFEGHKQTDVNLPDPYKLTYLKPGYSKLNFTFPDLNGKPVSLSDDKYKGKVVIVEVIGTWCPNCTDQTRFLSPWFNENHHRGVEAIAVGFEQVDSLDYAKTTLGRLKQFFDIRYDVVFGGIADKKVATEKLAGLNYMAAFPTTILIDRKGDVRQIYTGYTGQITGQYYQDYVKRFNHELDALIAEPVPESIKQASAAAGDAAPTANNLLPQGR